MRLFWIDSTLRGHHWLIQAHHSFSMLANLGIICFQVFNRNKKTDLKKGK